MPESCTEATVCDFKVPKCSTKAAVCEMYLRQMALLNCLSFSIFQAIVDHPTVDLPAFSEPQKKAVRDNS